MISVHVKAKHFADTQVLRDVRFSVEPGEVLAIVGPSGIGKSTLLRIIAGLDQSFSGAISAPSKLGMVFQEPNLLPWRRVLANLTLMHPGIPEVDIRAMLERVGLSGKADLWPRQLSLGQQRRLALARAFLGAPGLLILDEPFTSLDRQTRDDMLALTEGLIREHRPAT